MGYEGTSVSERATRREGTMRVGAEPYKLRVPWAKSETYREQSVVRGAVVRGETERCRRGASAISVAEFCRAAPLQIIERR